MENENIRKIDLYRAQGYGYRRIAALLDMQTETVKKYCQRHPVAGKEKAGENHCAQCGKSIEQTVHRKAKRFCSDKCRMAWWNAHAEKLNRKTLHMHTCRKW